jgi:hypothetical protein
MPRSGSPKLSRITVPDSGNSALRKSLLSFVSPQHTQLSTKRGKFQTKSSSKHRKIMVDRKPYGDLCSETRYKSSL